MGVIRTCIRNRRDSNADSTRERETAVDKAIGLSLWFRLRVRHLQIASFLCGGIGAGSLTLALRIAAALLGCLAGKELLARQTPADRQYSGDQNCNNRFVREERHLLSLLYRGRLGTEPGHWANDVDGRDPSVHSPFQRELFDSRSCASRHLLLSGAAPGDYHSLESLYQGFLPLSTLANDRHGLNVVR